MTRKLGKVLQRIQICPQTKCLPQHRGNSKFEAILNGYIQIYWCKRVLPLRLTGYLMASTPILTQSLMIKFLQSLISASSLWSRFYAQTDNLRLEVVRIEKLLSVWAIKIQGSLCIQYKEKFYKALYLMTRFQWFYAVQVRIFKYYSQFPHLLSLGYVPTS